MKYDVIVVGGGTAGCAAAYTSAQKGLKTLLIEKNSFLGGTMTGALVTPAMKTSDCQINTDFFYTFINELKALGGCITYTDNNPCWFNPELAKIALDRLLTTVGVKILFNTYITKVTKDNNIISSINISTQPLILSEPIETINILKGGLLSEPIETKYIVDTTAEQVICNALNCDCIDDGALNQPASLRFIASGVNLCKFKDFILELDPNRDATSAAVIGDEIHLSTACTWDKEWALLPLFKDAFNKNLLKESDCAYFQVFTIPGMPNSIAFNCPRFTSTIVQKDIESLSQSLIEAREAMLRFIKFCKMYFPGFESAYISNIAPLVGTRVSKRAKGKYVYTIDDLKNGKKFATPVLISNYPIDVHASKKEDSTLEKVMQEYQLPIESLISSNYPNLFFAGRGISADFYAQAALRIIPSCFSMGEGLAKYIAQIAN